MAPAAHLLDAALARQRLALAWPAVGVERVALGEAAGRVLHEAVIAPEDFPSFARAAMDGYAVPAIATLGATAATPVALVLGQTAWPIATGGPVPGLSDAVVMVEQTRSPDPGSAAGHVSVLTEVRPGQNVSAQGSDVRQGAVLAAAGRRLTPRDLALLGAVGIGEIVVARRPRVAILSSGAELVSCGVPLPPGGVRDVNQPALCAAVAAAGGVATAAGILTDDRAALGQAVARLVPSHDLILVSGGTSVGLADHTAAALHGVGAVFLFHGLAIRPGRPTLAAVLGRTLIVGLPGVPTAALTVFEIFVRPLLVADDRRLSVRLAAALSSVAGREDYVRVGLETRADGVWAIPVSGGASSLSALATADGVAIIPAETTALAAGEGITVLPF